MSTAIEQRKELSRNEKAVVGLVIFCAVVVVVGVVGYCEVLFLQIIGRTFPDGFLKVIAMLGGVATGLSVITLLAAKIYWFRPGPQNVVSWFFMFVETVILILNTLLSFALASNSLKPGDFLSTWYTLCPSSPIFALVGWSLLIMFDRSQKERHDYMEMEDDQREAELKHEKAKHQARMNLRARMLNVEEHYIDQYMQSAEWHDSMRSIAHQFAHHELSTFAGRYIMSDKNLTSSTQLPSAKVVDASVSDKNLTPPVEQQSDETDQALKKKRTKKLPEE